MTNKSLIILASARKQSNTREFVNKVFAQTEHKIIDLSDYRILPYTYAANYPQTDEFLKVIEELINHKVIIFATPVYWYAMSGLLKIFFDRFTDLVTVQKQLGRRLKGKEVFLVAVGADKELPPGFELPFRLTAEYLNMSYHTCIYHSTNYPDSNDGAKVLIKSFTDRIEKV